MSRIPGNGLTGRMIAETCLLAVFAMLSCCGCPASPPSLVFAVIGESLDDADVKKREPELIGRGESAADEMFGFRYDTVTDRHSGKKFLIYVVRGQPSGVARYVVEMSDDKIIDLFKTEHNVDGIGDSIRTDDLKSKIVGKPADAIAEETDLGEPELTMHSRRTGGLIRVYDVQGALHAPGSRYCVLEFDRRDRCKSVRMVGVTGSTKAGPPTE